MHVTLYTELLSDYLVAVDVKMVLEINNPDIQRKIYMDKSIEHMTECKD